MSDHENTPKGDILIVDDRADNLRLLSTMLSDHGYKVRKVIKGELTFDVAQVNPPDLILLDIFMPQINGFEVCQQLKADERTCAIPIIFLSASDEPLDKVKAFSVGGEDYITKPFEIQEILARIEHQLRLVRLQRQMRDQNQQLQAEVAERMKAEAALQQINDELEERVTRRTVELTQTNQRLQLLGQQLQQALAQERELSSLRSRIITTISHEYRTPMAIISSSAGILEEYFEQLTTDLRLKHLHRIQGAIQRMLSLIDDVILLNGLEFEKVSPQLKPLQLHPLLDDLVNQFLKVTHSSHPISVNLSERCDQPIADASLVAHILQSLCSNAIKFSPPGSIIALDVDCTDEQLVLKVQDAGVGIPEDEIERIFEPFYRAGNTDNIQGLGIGLAIAKKCIHLMSGEIEVKSKVGQGTTMVVKLPCRSPVVAHPVGEWGP